MLSQLLQFIQTSPELIVTVCLLSSIFLWISLRHRTRIKSLQAELRQIRNDLKALTASSIGVGGRLKQLERKSRSMPEPVASVPVAPARSRAIDLYEPANQPYDHAIHLAQQGKGVDEIVSICGVSQNEAELIQMMHRLEQAC